ncbi:hypothetical protein BTVI_05669 [Pitangus sulphuratus]|nr:hypothetical protein BTVI_05669 [Pitangus sulphuratus]
MLAMFLSACSEYLVNHEVGNQKSHMLCNRDSDIDSGIKYILNIFADDTKLSSAADIPEEWHIISEYLDKLEKWDSGKLKMFSKDKCKVLHLSQGNPWYQQILK